MFGGYPMRILTAVLMIAALTVSAHAQSGRQLTRPKEEPKPKVDDKGYESALKNAGTQGQAFDPWRTVREPPATAADPPVAKDPKAKTKTKTTSRSTAKQ